MTEAPERWVWIDIETTGLDPEQDALLELAIVVTTSVDLEIQAEFTSLVVDAAEAAPIRCKAHGIFEMHHTSGLLSALRDRQDDPSCLAKAVEQRALAFLEEQTGERRFGPMCGSTIAFDRSFLKVHMPELQKRFHYRNLDVSTINELARCWNPRLKAYAKRLQRETHRALADIRDSIELLRFYRASGMVGKT